MFRIEDIQNPRLLEKFLRQTQKNEQQVMAFGENIEESRYTCPICGHVLYLIPGNHHVLDGNSVYMCAAHEEHMFWQNAREHDLLHLSMKSSSTNFESDRDFSLGVEGEWVEYTALEK